MIMCALLAENTNVSFGNERNARKHRGEPLPAKSNSYAKWIVVSPDSTRDASLSRDLPALTRVVSWM